MIKNVVLYVRVSTDEQKEKGYSLPAQEKKLTDYCKQKGYNILETFSEDYSAWKGFDRPAYNELKKYVTKNKKEVDAIFVTQWSRFSRDTASSYKELDELKQLGIEANAIEQHIDFSIPENQYLLGFYLVAPQVENDRLSLRTKDGMKQALRQGRWLWKAPYGYYNEKVSKLIIPTEKESQGVQFIFSTFQTGKYTMEEVRRMAIEAGYPLQKQSFINLLNNPLYAGLIPEKDNKGNIIAIHKGIHQPLISEQTFNEVQLIIKGKKKPYQGKTRNDAFPLKGYIICPDCGKLMTGSTSKGNGGLYSYYHCQRKYGCNTAYKADVVNNAFEKELTQFHVRSEVLALYSIILKDTFNTSDTERDTKRKALETSIKYVKEQIGVLDERFSSGSLPIERYNRLSQNLENRENELVMEHATLGKASADYEKYVATTTILLSDVSGFYSRASLIGKQKLIGSIYPEKLIFDGEKYRTEKMNQVFSLLINVHKAFKRKQPDQKVELSRVAPKAGLEPATL
jgi:site-specific DNA recombinase